ncbi:Thioredoxin reductase [Enterobacter ludwigii]|uniref:Thioredoxin reductase n=3 Tax=Enterobacteriaceae TaxID=543 RepID=G8LDJ5_9ENTR|nr:Thioredoxin reductase [Enterobacter ludwigii]
MQFHKFARCARASTSPYILNTELITMNDVIIIGGSFAGLAAALQLGRARRKVTVLDTGRQRNRFAARSHGVLGHDHKPPQDILAEARQQLARYPTIKLVNARAESVSGTIDDFCVVTDDNESLRARRLILSYGVADQMPDIPGFAESWGTSIIPCPYCDGFEVADQHWGLIWSGVQSHNQVRLFHDWTNRLTVFGNGHDISLDIRADLATRQVPLIDGRITEIEPHGSHSATIRIESGPDVSVDILFAHPRTRPSASLHDALGLATVNTPTGIALKTDERRETSMPGIYAAGDLANPGIPSVTTAAWQGTMAGIFAQQSMLS